MSSTSVGLSAITGLNRNILECKFCPPVLLVIYNSCLNRNILECKSEILSAAAFLSVVLIETYWNVNTADTAPGELISRLNRNILECKLYDGQEVIYDYTLS